MVKMPTIFDSAGALFGNFMAYYNHGYVCLPLQQLFP
jgi:hypothetical protein